MRRILQTVLASVVLVPLTQVLPVSLSAGIFCNHGFNPCGICHPCQTCHVNPCRCQAAVVPQVQATPVVSYRDVTRTEYRLQAETQTVPVTTHQTVTVDEGGWQKVWVPRLVSKQVPQTVYQQQIVYKQVPYQITQRIPQVSWQATPRALPRVTGGTIAGCNTCGAPTTWNPYGYSGVVGAAPVITGPTTGSPVTLSPPIIGGPLTVPAAPSQQPVQLGRELQPLDATTDSSASSSSSLGPVPDPAYLDTPQASNFSNGEWTPVLTAKPTPAPPASPAAAAPPRTSSAAGRFVPAPSAANVWRTRVR